MPKALSLDKSKPYGEICGCLIGRRYEQDGNVFDANGALFETEPAKPKKAPTAAEKALALGAGPDQLSAQLEG